MKVDLVKYRDAGMNSYTYFWVTDNKKTVSPYFDTDKEAIEWLKEQANFEIRNIEK